jgi:dTDP-4-dehydrorhamnose reductase
MRFLVLGANGMAGHTVCLYLQSRGHDVVGFARAASPLVETVVGDVRDTEFLSRRVRDGAFDAVINCVGILNADADRDRAGAVYINALLPHMLAEYAHGGATQVVHLSTDCVFSGKRGRYREDDFRDGETFYDRSKALGELEGGKCLTLRTSIVGPDLSPKGIGLLNWFMQQPGPVNGYTGAIWNGQTTLQLAKTIEYATERRIEGLYNIVPEGTVSKYELLQLFNRHLRYDAVQVNPVLGLSADKSLVRTRLALDCPVPEIPQMVAELAEWMRSHRSHYPHYAL